MFAESKLTFAAWTGFGITAASIGTVVYQKSSGFGSSDQKNQGTKDKLMKKLNLGDSGKQKPKEESKSEKKPVSSTDNKQKFQESKDQNQEIKVPKVPEAEEENLDQKKEQGKNEESFDSGIPSFTLGGEDDDQLELETKK